MLQNLNLPVQRSMYGYEKQKVSRGWPSREQSGYLTRISRIYPCGLCGGGECERDIPNQVILQQMNALEVSKQKVQAIDGLRADIDVLRGKLEELSSQKARHMQEMQDLRTKGSRATQNLSDAQHKIKNQLESKRPRI